MTNMELQPPNDLRHELQGRMADGEYERSVIHVGCLGCAFAQGIASRSFSVGRLVELMDEFDGVPRTFITEEMEAIGKARGCPIDPATEQPDCQHQARLITAPSRLRP